MRSFASVLALTLLVAGTAGAAAVPAANAQAPRARIWVENDRDYFRRGDRLRVSFNTTANSYVAVVHIDPDGYLEFLYPTTPWDDEFVRAGRTYAVDRSGWSNGMLVRGSSGIGYLYVIASPVPLDYSRFRAGSGWDWSYAGRSVVGDPFFAMEQITRLLLPGWSNSPYAYDYYTYYVGGMHRYPSYACSRQFSGYGWGYYPGWNSYYGSCDRLDLFVRDNPYYFDSRRYRGNRNVYYDRYRDSRDWDPRHGYKANPENTSRPATRVQVAPQNDGRARVVPSQQGGAAAPTSRPAQRVEPARPAPQPAAQAPRVTPRQDAGASDEQPRPRPAPAAPRPVERQPAREEASRRQPERAAPARPAPAPSRQPERAAPQRSSGETTRSSTPSSRGSSDGGSTSTPRSRRGGE